MYKMYLISAEGYKNVGVDLLKIRKTGKIWVSMKDAHNGLGVKSNSDLVLKEIYWRYEKKTSHMNKLINIKSLKEMIILKSMII